MVYLRVKVVPGARQSEIAGLHADGIKVRVAAPAERGKANMALVQLLAQALGIPASRIELVSGQAQPRKVLRIHGLDDAQLQQWLKSL